MIHPFISSLIPLAVAAGLAAAAIPSPAPHDPALPPSPPWAAPLDRDHPLAGQVWLPKEGRTVSPDELVAAMKTADFVLLGERHDNPDHHALQAWLVRRLIETGRRPAVAFEMFGTDKSAAIADYLKRAPADARGLGKATNWEATGWPAWRHYSPIAQAALDAGLPVLAANIPETEAKAMARRKPIDPDRVGELGLDRPLPAPLHRALADEIRSSHCDMLPEAAVSPMLMAQRAKDGSMARAIAKAAMAPDTDGAVLIAGSGHVRNDRGVPQALSWAAPGARSFSVAFIEAHPETTDPAAYAELYGESAMPFDAVWFTARMGGEDPCAAFAEHMKKRKSEK